MLHPGRCSPAGELRATALGLSCVHDFVTWSRLCFFNEALSFSSNALPIPSFLPARFVLSFPPYVCPMAFTTNLSLLA